MAYSQHLELTMRSMRLRARAALLGACLLTTAPINVLAADVAVSWARPTLRADGSVLLTTTPVTYTVYDVTAEAIKLGTTQALSYTVVGVPDCQKRRYTVTARDDTSAEGAQAVPASFAANCPPMAPTGLTAAVK